MFLKLRQKEQLKYKVYETFDSLIIVYSHLLGAMGSAWLKLQFFLNGYPKQLAK
jgi:hypothetical protein